MYLRIFRRLSHTNYRLDPAHYVSSPQLSWDAMLLFTGCELELISDPEMFNQISPGIRGGVSMIVHRYAKANNPEMGTAYDPAAPLSYITIWTQIISTAGRCNSHYQSVDLSLFQRKSGN